MNEMTTAETLRRLAAQINAAHNEAEAAMRTTLEHAIRVGDLLSRAKAKVSHGEWADWLAANVTFSERTAQVYMRTALRKREIESKAQFTALLTIADAVDLLATPKAEPEVIDVEWEKTAAALPSSGLTADGQPALDREFRYTRVGTSTKGCCLIELDALPRLNPAETGFYWTFAVIHFEAGVADYCGRGVQSEYVLQILAYSLGKLGFVPESPWIAKPANGGTANAVQWEQEREAEEREAEREKRLALSAIKGE